jgi:electron transfer flavoprotein alpha subunit
MGPNVSCLVIGHKLKDIVNTLTKVNGINKILVAENELFKGFLPEVLTQLVVATHKQFNFSHIISGASAVGKVDIIFDLIFI